MEEVAALTEAVTASRLADVEALLAAHPGAATAQPWGDAGSLLHVAAESSSAEVCSRRVPCSVRLPCRAHPAAPCARVR